MNDYRGKITGYFAWLETLNNSKSAAATTSRHEVDDSLKDLCVRLSHVSEIFHNFA